MKKSLNSFVENKENSCYLYKKKEDRILPLIQKRSKKLSKFFVSSFPKAKKNPLFLVVRSLEEENNFLTKGEFVLGEKSVKEEEYPVDKIKCASFFLTLIIICGEKGRRPPLLSPNRCSPPSWSPLLATPSPRLSVL